MTVEGLTAAAQAAAIAAGNVKLSGDTVQVVHTQNGALATGTTILPGDNTIPQITEGDQYMTLAITPTNSSNTLDIDVRVILGNSTAAFVTAALFQDATANALAAQMVYQSAANGVNLLTFRYRMAAGTTSATTFRVRGGLHVAGTTTFNGSAGTQYMGGLMASSITITEIKA